MTDKQPIGWIYEDDEGRITFSQMPQNPPFWEPVYRSVKKAELIGLTKREYEEAVDGLEDLEDCWIAIEAKLLEKNTLG
jgi:hypothetical protein